MLRRFDARYLVRYVFNNELSDNFGIEYGHKYRYVVGYDVADGHPYDVTDVNCNDHIYETSLCMRSL